MLGHQCPECRSLNAREQVTWTSIASISRVLIRSELESEPSSEQASVIIGSNLSAPRDGTGAAGAGEGSGSGSGSGSGAQFSRIGPFRIEPRTGHVLLASALDRETNYNFTLVVLASDRGSPPLTSTALLHVLVRLCCFAYSIVSIVTYSYDPAIQSNGGKSINYMYEYKYSTHYCTHDLYFVLQ